MWGDQQSGGPDRVEDKEISTGSDNLNKKNSEAEGNSRLNRDNHNAERGKWHNNQRTISNLGQVNIRQPRGPDNEGNWKANRWRRDEGGNSEDIRSIIQGSKSKRSMSSTEPSTSLGINQAIPYRKSHFKPDFNIKTWLKMTQKEPEMILIDVTQHTDDFKTFFSTNLTLKDIISLIDIFSRMCKSNFLSNLASVLVFIIGTKFIKQVENMVLQLPIIFGATDNFKGDEFFTKLSIFCGKIAELIPSSAEDVLPQVLNAISYTIPNFEKASGESINNETKTAIKSLHGSLEDTLKKKKDMIKRKKDVITKEKMHDFNHEDGEAPDNFRNIPILPTAEEITTYKEVFLRHNKVQGNYQNAEHYLDVQFRLIREDFVAPLREGICNYLKQPQDQNHCHTSIKIYKDVLVNGHHGIQYCATIQFMKQARDNKQQMKQSKSFLFGSLLCFSRDNFKTIVFGSVEKNDIISDGRLDVIFDEGQRLIHQGQDGSAYVMVECKVNFKTYKNVLRALQRLDLTKFILRDYFISINDVKDDIKSPNYLRGLTLSSSSEGLNLSQSDAYNAGLTKEVSVIQGPPGTGKTFLGLKLVQTLLENNKMWRNKGPILVLCMTNHALDQFLEGILKFTDSIVRIGGQSKSEALKKYNMKNMKRLEFKPRKLSALISDRLDKVLEQQKEWDTLSEKLYLITSYTGVLKFDFFENILQNYKKCWFYRASNKEIINWLFEEFNQNYVPFVHQSQSESSMENWESARKYLEEVKIRISCIIDPFIDSENIAITDKDFLIRPDYLKKIITYLSEKNEKLNPECSKYFKNQYVVDYYKAKYEYILSKLEMLKQTDESYLPQFNYFYNPFFMPIEERWLFYNHLLLLCKPLIKELFKIAGETYRLCCDEYNEAKKMLDLNVMSDKMVVGMTTSAAATLQSALKYLQSPIVIVEEAAEVLESHVLTALSSECEQLILLGDHKQLRPSTADYTIEHDYFLEISLFERYISNGFPFNQLNVQYKMRPEIASLLTPIIYKTLDNHPSVYDKPKPPGIINPLYFITHEHRETSTNATTKENRHEATYLLKLAKYLVLNGIKPEKITILAAYAGQFLLLLREINQYPELVHTVIAVLDNYQGEENDIILLSLVRNNENDSIGFLAFENRICVALSRAKNGMYIMGNIHLLSSRSETWSKIKVKLEEIDSIGTALKLCCLKHPDQITSIENIEDFNQVPEGGCIQLCNDLLQCGHNCVIKCHPRDHNDVLCYQQCVKELCKFGHQCPRLCHESCDECLVSKHCILKCGHEKDIPCYMDPENVRCEVNVLTKFPCGHSSDKKCFAKRNFAKCFHPCEKRNKGCLSPEDPTHMCKNKCSEVCSPCNIQVKKHHSVCSHVNVVDCSQYIDRLPCTKPCKKSMDCGHQCQKQCGHQFHCDCNVEVDKVIPECGHIIKLSCILQKSNYLRMCCRSNCSQTLPCGHKCKQECRIPCDQSKCTELSTTILSVCGHEVILPCNVPSNEHDKVISSYCEKKCSKTLECGHVCGGTCGKCSQGRMHLACVENCNRILACGHKCLIKCNQPCQPCQSNCTYQCAHTKCKEKCGAPCTLCTKECKRKCQHQSCTKLCHEICDVQPCMEACIEKLNCGHDCMGYCGDPCPQKCHICDKEEVEDNTDKKYVRLEDCKHIFKSTDLEKLFTIQNGFIWLAQCPKCSSNIIKTQRYHDYIKLAYKNIQQVKKQHHGRPEKIEADRKALLARAEKLALSSLGPLEMHICEYFLQILNPIATNPNRKETYEQFQFIYSSKFGLFEKLILVILKNNGLEQFHATNQIMLNLLVWIYEQSEFITNEEILSYKSELIRFSHAIQLFKIADKIDCNSSEYLECINMLLSIDPYTDESAYKSKLYLKTLYGTNLIEEIYWEELPKAIDFSKDYWIKCKEGHVFVRDGGRIGCLMCEQPENIDELEFGALNINDFMTDKLELIRFCDLGKENSDTENSDVEDRY